MNNFEPDDWVSLDNGKGFWMWEWNDMKVENKQISYYLHSIMESRPSKQSLIDWKYNSSIICEKLIELVINEYKVDDLSKNGDTINEIDIKIDRVMDLVSLECKFCRLRKMEESKNSEIITIKIYKIKLSYKNARKMLNEVKRKMIKKQFPIE